MKSLGWFAGHLLGRIAPNRGRDPNRPYVPFKLQGPPPLIKAKRLTWFVYWKTGEFTGPISSSVKSYSVHLQDKLEQRVALRVKAWRKREARIRQKVLENARLLRRRGRAIARPKKKVEVKQKALKDAQLGREEERAIAQSKKKVEIKQMELEDVQLEQEAERAIYQSETEVKVKHRALEDATMKPQEHTTARSETKTDATAKEERPLTEEQEKARQLKRERQAEKEQHAAETRRAKKEQLAEEVRLVRERLLAKQALKKQAREKRALEKQALEKHIQEEQEKLVRDKTKAKGKKLAPVQPPPSQPMFKPIASRSSASRRSDTLGAGWVGQMVTRESPRQYYGPRPAPPMPRSKPAQSFVSPRLPSEQPAEALPEPRALAEHYEQMGVLQSPNLKPENAETVSSETIDYLMDLTQRQAMRYQGPYERFSVANTLAKVYGMPGASKTVTGDMPKVVIQGTRNAIAYAQSRCYQWPSHISIFVDASCTAFFMNATPIPKPTSVGLVMKNKLPVGRASLFVPQNDEWTIRGFHSKESLDSSHSEAVALLQGVRLIYDEMERAILEGRPVDKAHVDIFSDSRQALRSIKNIETARHRRRELLEKVCEICIELKKVGVTIELHWVPGHTDNTESEFRDGSSRKAYLPTQRVPGNILADIVAYRGSKRGRDPGAYMVGSAGTNYGVGARSAIK